MATAKPKALDLGTLFVSADEIEDGFWTETEFGLEVRLRRVDAPSVRRAFMEFRDKASRGRRRLDADKQADIDDRVTAREIFLGYKGVVIVQGEELEDSFNSRMTIIQVYPDVKRELLVLAADEGRAQRDHLAEDSLD